MTQLVLSVDIDHVRCISPDVVATGFFQEKRVGMLELQVTGQVHLKGLGFDAFQVPSECKHVLFCRQIVINLHAQVHTIISMEY